jgi:hypothetical protein
MQRNLHSFLSYLHHYLEEEVTSNSGIAMVYQNEIDGRRTWPEFEKEMQFYVPVGVILIELEDFSDYATGIESRSLLHDETDFVSSNDTRSQIRAEVLWIGYDGTRAELWWGNSR